MDFGSLPQRAGAMLREALAAARSQPVGTVLTLVMTAGMVIAALLTTGQTAATERAAMAQIDAVGTRSVIVRAQEGAGLTSAVVDRINSLAEVESVIAFGPLLDIRNAIIPGAPLLGARPVYGDLMVANAQPGAVYASLRAADHLGLIDRTGAVTTFDSLPLIVRGTIAVPDHLGFLEPLAVIAPDASVTGFEPVNTLIVLADDPRHVLAITRAVVGLLGVTDPQLVTIETSTELAAVRAAVSGELGTYGRATVLGILGVAALLVAANLFGSVQMRRKDFGRRRALGASQLLIVGLLLTQTAVLALVGAGLGIVASNIILLTNGNPLAGPDFTLAVAVSAILTALVAAILPAIAAANREPLTELRVA